MTNNSELSEPIKDLIKFLDNIELDQTFEDQESPEEPLTVFNVTY